ncbi:HpcH/HpaI aldolase/citrate lyase family protein [Vibrio owensii]|uniref:HpcH/HpaI aldolase/citrate lyase family protein n=1 Tax=Vibrio harveyi group TaxID=717610 RepID=UPI003CC57B3C
MANYFELGASLYTPATNFKLQRHIENGLSGARSMVICTEDAVAEEELESSLVKLEAALSGAVISKKIARFIRPRNPEVLARILKMEGVNKVDGFVLPKCDFESMPAFLSVLSQYATKRFGLMPTLESVFMCQPAQIQQFRCLLEGVAEHDIVCIRIGGNDLFNELGLKRMPETTIYETPIRSLIDNIVTGFRPHGFEVAAPVFDYSDDRATLKRELKTDVAYGFFAKTAIHPNQVPVIEEYINRYVVEHHDIAASLKEESRAVYLASGQMMEKTCHSNWAERTLMLANAR